MFYTENKNEKPQGQEMTFQQGVIVIGVLLCVFGYRKISQLEYWYMRHFETIYITGYAVIVALVAGAIYQIKKKTKPLEKRMAVLAGLGNQHNAIGLGVTTDNRAVFLSDELRTGHVQIIGSTGRGKTQSVILPWACRDIARRRNLILIDGKGDSSLVPILEAVTQEKNPLAKFSVFDLGNIEGSCTTNPLEFGTPQQITDRIFTAFTFDASYYKSVQYDVAGTVIELIQKSEKTSVTFQRFYTLLTKDEALTKSSGECTDLKLKEKLTRFLQIPKKEREEKMSGLLSQIAPFATGEIAPLVNGPKEGKEYTTISDVVMGAGSTQKILVLLVPTLLYQDLGLQLGKLLFQELGTVIGYRANSGIQGPFLPVFCDEFSSFVYPGFVNILNKARSTGIGLHLSHQSLGDLSAVSESFAKTINTNTNTKCILGLNDPETADFFARHMGTQTEEKKTERAKRTSLLWPTEEEKTGDLSLREVEAYKIHPNSLKSYTQGFGVLHVPTRLGNFTEEVQFMPLQRDE